MSDSQARSHRSAAPSNRSTWPFHRATLQHADPNRRLVPWGIFSTCSASHMLVCADVLAHPCHCEKEAVAQNALVVRDHHGPVGQGHNCRSTQRKQLITSARSQLCCRPAAQQKPCLRTNHQPPPQLLLTTRGLHTVPQGIKWVSASTGLTPRGWSRLTGPESAKVPKEEGWKLKVNLCTQVQP